MDGGHSTESADWPALITLDFVRPWCCRPGSQLSTMKTNKPGFPPVHTPRSPTQMVTNRCPWEEREMRGYNTLVS